VKPSEVVIDFIHNSYKFFKGGIFWLSCKCSEIVSACIDNVEKVIM